MKVILRKAHETLGPIGTLVEVKDGYARNYLIPRGLAYPATDGSMRALAEEKQQADRRTTKERRTSERLAADLEKVSLTIKMKVGEDEKLFGSVTAQMVSDALKEKGMEIDKRIIDIAEPIKALGIYPVNVKLPQGVTGIVKVWVVRE